MSPIERKVSSITEDRRGGWTWDTRIAAEAAQCGPPRKFGEWWWRTQRKLIELAIAMPGETAAEMLGVIALAEAERQRRQSNEPPPARHPPRDRA